MNNTLIENRREKANIVTIHNEVVIKKIEMKVQTDVMKFRILKTIEGQYKVDINSSLYLGLEYDNIQDCERAIQDFIDAPLNLSGQSVKL